VLPSLISLSSFAFSSGPYILAIYFSLYDYYTANKKASQPKLLAF